MKFCRSLLLAFSTFAAFLAAQTCPPVTLLTTPRITAADKQTILTQRQSDGTFTGYTGPRTGPFLMASQTPNFQTAITSCYPFTGKKGSAPFSSYNRTGWASTLGDTADLDGDGIPDAVLIAYKPNLLYIVLMAASGVPKAMPLPLPIPGPPVSVRAVDVNKDGRPDLIVAAGNGVTGSPAASIYVLLNTGNGTFSTPTLFAAGGYPSSFAVIDINGDGNPDLVVADLGAADGEGGGVALLYGNGTGGFSSPSFLSTSNSAVQSVVVGDFNGDGKLDVAASNGTVISLFTGTGPGAFSARTTFPAGGDSAYLAMGDFNGDGKLDLVSSNLNQQTATVLLNNGAASGGFLPPVSYVISHGRSPDFLVVTDFNNDGVPDIVGGTGTPSVIAGNSNNALDVLLGNGDGTFSAPPAISVSTTSPIAFAVAGDFNGDGKMDVAAMAQHSTSLLFYAGHGDGTFAAPVTTALGPTFSNAIGAVAGDFNGDNVPDIAILTTGGFGIALSLKNGTFQPENQIYNSALTTGGLALGDFNGDGKLDIATTICSTNGGPTAVHVYNGNGAGAFTDTQPFRLNYCPTAFVGVDLNGDKKPDIVSLNDSTPAAGAYSSVDVFINQGQGVFASAKGYGLDPNGTVIMTIVDVNGDGKPDIVAASNFSTPFSISTLLNNGDGTFGNRISTLLATPPTAIFGADLNGDNNGDVVMVPAPFGASIYNDLAVAVSNGDGTFRAPVHYGGPGTTSLQFADFNNDGRPDLLAASPAGAPFGYFVTILNAAPPSSLQATLSAVNGASFQAGAPIAVDSIATVFGSHLAVAANPGGTTVTVKDSAGTTRTGQLFFAASAQVNFQVPPGTASGTAIITVTAADGTTNSGPVQIVNVAPGMFPVDAAGLFAGNILRVRSDGTQSTEQDYQLDVNNNVIPLPLNLGVANGDQVFLIMFGTGVRHAAAVTATVGNQSVPVAFAGAQGAFVGEDQINIGPLPASLAGTGIANIIITADGQVANTVNLTIQ